MTASGYLQIAFYLVAVVALAQPLGAANIYEGQACPAEPSARRSRRVLYRLLRRRVRPKCALDPVRARALWFSLFGMLLAYALQRLQNYLRSIPPWRGVATPRSIPR
jgi:K+-transporting ATPase ATPase A chain